MMIFRALIVFIMVIANSSASAEEQSQNMRNNPYVFCNVFLSNACFGIAQGDKLGMEVFVDYVLYNVSFSFGRSATIYSGFNPEVDQSLKFERCLEHNGFAECNRRNLDDGSIELLARRDKNSPFLHVIVSAGEGGIDHVNFFLQNIRSCNRKGNVIRCTQRHQQKVPE